MTATTKPPRLFTPAFAALSLAVLVFFVAGGILLPVTPLFSRDVLLADQFTIGLVIGAFAVSSLLMRPFAGRLTDRRGRRIALVIGAAISIAAMVGHLIAFDVPTLIFMRLALGAGEALFFVAGLAAATDLAPEDRRGESISLVSLSLYLGIAIGPLLGDWVQEGWGFAAVWIVTAGLYVVSVALSWIVPETLVRDGPAPLGSQPEPRRKPSLIHPRGVTPGLLALCGVWGMGPFFTFIPLIVEDAGLGTSGPYLGVFAIVVVVLRFLGARLPDRLGAGKLAGTALVATTIGLLISGLAVGRVIPLGEGLFLGTAVFGAGVAFTMPAIMAMAVIGVRPDERGSVVGTAGLFVDSAFALSPAVLGLLAALVDYPATFLVSAVISAVGVVYLRLRPPTRTLAPAPSATS